MDVTDLSKLSWAEWSLVKIGRGVLHTAHMLFWFALCVPLIQVILWLRSGAWPDLSVFNTLSWAFPAWLIDWLNYPNNWFGLHEIVAWFVWNCPLFIFLLLVAGVWFAGGTLTLASLFNVVAQDSDDEQ